MKLTTPVLIIFGVLILGGLFFVFKPKMQNIPPSTNTQNNQQTNGNPPSTPTSTINIFELVIKDKKIVSGTTTITVNQGDEITINITADEAEELHVHAYDNSVKLEPNTKTPLTFTANLSGRFPFELEKSKTEIGVLEVQPK